MLASAAALFGGFAVSGAQAQSDLVNGGDLLEASGVMGQSSDVQKAQQEQAQMTEQMLLDAAEQMNEEAAATASEIQEEAFAEEEEEKKVKYIYKDKGLLDGVEKPQRLFNNVDPY